MRIAIVGSGVAGLTAAYLLHSVHDVTLFEADDRLGGHAHTQVVERDGTHVPIDTGFMVFNTPCYPTLTALFDELGVRSRPSDMSFSVADATAGIEWRSSNLSTIFAQRRNLLRPTFWRMLVDIGRFNRAARAHLISSTPDCSLEAFLRQSNYGESFRSLYLIPMGAAIWSANPTTFADFPARSLFRFLDNHGLLSLTNRPQWRTVVGGSQTYVAAIAAQLGDRVRLNTVVTAVTRVPDGVRIDWHHDAAVFDHVILATHSDQALAVLATPTAEEQAVLGSIRYASNRATLHTDSSLLPAVNRARASWNYCRLPGATSATLTYDVSKLQGHDGPTPFLVTLNQDDAIDPASVLATMTYAHPIFDAAAIAAQDQHATISGVDRISYVGAYWGYGFHEDGARSGAAVAQALGGRPLRGHP